MSDHTCDAQISRITMSYCLKTPALIPLMTPNHHCKIDERLAQVAEDEGCVNLKIYDELGASSWEVNSM
jgi:hypothetical protein